MDELLTKLDEYVGFADLVRSLTFALLTMHNRCNDFNKDLHNILLQSCAAGLKKKFLYCSCTAHVHTT